MKNELLVAAWMLCGLATVPGCGESQAPATAPPLTAEQQAAVKQEEASVQDAEREQQKVVQRKPAGKK